MERIDGGRNGAARQCTVVRWRYLYAGLRGNSGNAIVELAGVVDAFGMRLSRPWRNVPDDEI